MSPLSDFYGSLLDVWIMTTRNLKHYIRLPQLIFFSSVQPIMFLLLFNYVFGGAIGLSISDSVPGGKYIYYLLPGILIQMVMFGGVNTGIGLAEDMNKGIIDRFKSLPMSRIAVVAARTLSDSIRNFAVIIIMLAVGMLIGFRFQAGFWNAVLMVVISLIFGFSLSWVFAFVGMSVKDSETAQLASFLLIFPLVFASSAFVPIQSMPSWLQVFARNQPVTMVVEAARHFALGIPADGAVWKTLLWCLAFLIVFMPLAIRQYKRRTT